MHFKFFFHANESIIRSPRVLDLLSFLRSAALRSHRSYSYFRSKIQEKSVFEPLFRRGRENPNKLRIYLLGSQKLNTGGMTCMASGIHCIKIPYDGLKFLAKRAAAAGIGCEVRLCWWHDISISALRVSCLLAVREYSALSLHLINARKTPKFQAQIIIITKMFIVMRIFLSPT